MPNYRDHPPGRAMRRQRGTSLIEVLVTLVIVAFGLLGVAAFQAKAQVGSVESYQRAQAVILLEDMTNRISANGAGADGYISASVGTGDAQPASCAEVAAGAARDLCEWSNALKGAAEADASGTRVGAMIGARGCITRLVAADASTGVCRPAVYQVSVAWQGLHQTKAPSLTCGRTLYGNETYRRAVGARVTISLPACS
ncbi:MAG TPA: type IV pilus modification protein PilV [Telluria sp.]|nr:type IV pilus modification protein PilV [Telluria sp.]